MVSESKGCGVREERLWCQRVRVVVLESSGYAVRECRLWCKTVPVVEGNLGVGVEEGSRRALGSGQGQRGGDLNVCACVCVCVCVCACVCVFVCQWRYNGVTVVLPVVPRGG
jgi:hypothetical protein